MHTEGGQIHVHADHHPSHTQDAQRCIVHKEKQRKCEQGKRTGPDLKLKQSTRTHATWHAVPPRLAPLPVPVLPLRTPLRLR